MFLLFLFIWFDDVVDGLVEDLYGIFINRVWWEWGDEFEF